MSNLKALWVSAQSERRFDSLGGKNDSDEDVIRMLLDCYERAHPE